jgi:site-specific DNA-cytosine methylase
MGTYGSNREGLGIISHLDSTKGAIYTGGLAEVLRGLSELGYGFDVEIISAEEVGAPHLRERVFVVAYTTSYSGKHRPGQTKLDLKLRQLGLLMKGEVHNPQFVEWLMGFPTDWTDLRC